MTPERKEEIKAKGMSTEEIAEMLPDIRFDTPESEMYFRRLVQLENHAWSALEEAEQQVKTLKTEKALLKGELGQAEAYKHFEAERTKEAQSINRKLAEAQQQVKDFKSQRDHYRLECRKLDLLVKELHEDIQNLRVTGNKIEYELAEAQQTIARLTKALEQIMDITSVDYEDSFNKAIDVAYMALGLGEGAKES